MTECTSTWRRPLKGRETTGGLQAALELTAAAFGHGGGCHRRGWQCQWGGSGGTGEVLTPPWLPFCTLVTADPRRFPPDRLLLPTVDVAAVAMARGHRQRTANSWVTRACETIPRPLQMSGAAAVASAAPPPRRGEIRRRVTSAHGRCHSLPHGDAVYSDTGINTAETQFRRLWFVSSHRLLPAVSPLSRAQGATPSCTWGRRNRCGLCGAVT